MRSYSASRKTFNFLENLAYLGLISGGLLLVFGFTNFGGTSLGRGMSINLGPFLLVFGVSTLFGSLSLLVVAQIGRAGVDTAEYSQQMLQVARDSLEVSRQTLTKNTQFLQSYAEKAGTKEASIKGSASFTEAPKPTHASTDQPEAETPQIVSKPADEASFSSRAEPKNDGNLESYKGKTIALEDKRYVYNGIPFESLERARKYIDQFSG